MCKSQVNSRGILQGFFAGEGNVKDLASPHSRTLRIAQGRRLALLELMLHHFGVRFRYEVRGRSYCVSGRADLEKLFGLGISRLHSKKHSKLIAMLSTYKQYHHARYSTDSIILNALPTPKTAREVAAIIERTNARASQALCRLRHRRQVETYRVRSTNY